MLHHLWEPIIVGPPQPVGSLERGKRCKKFLWKIVLKQVGLVASGCPKNHLKYGSFNNNMELEPKQRKNQSYQLWFGFHGRRICSRQWRRGGNDFTGVAFAKQNVIRCLLNHRLGRLGFFAFPRSSKENPNERGNYGSYGSNSCITMG